MSFLRSSLVALVCAWTVAAPGERSAHAYEFETLARTIGQGYELTSFRRLSGNLQLSRRRFTQTLTLNLWDLSGRFKDRKQWDSEPADGPNMYFSTYMRIDHDFGGWTGGELVAGSRLVDAVDLIPELETSSLNLDILFGYVAADDLLDGRLDLHVGRQLSVDSLDWWSMDGATARVKTPWKFAVEAFGGLRVRDDSLLGSSVQEPDGTSGGECAEYVEDSAPGAGGWRPIDRDIPGENNPFTNDFDFCPQREKLMPTWGGAIETHNAAPIWARVSYRRTMSKTVGLIGPADRFAFEDTGLYPNETNQAPGWGVNEEYVTATVRTNLTFASGRARIVPYAAGRYSLLHGLIDEGHLGARLRYGIHSLETEAYYSFPTFDGDSIFNVFSTEPYTDFRSTYGLSPKGSSWRGYVRGWLRRYQAEDDSSHIAIGETVQAVSTTAGVQLGGRYAYDKDLLGRLDLFHEDGFGGRRTGGYGSVRWRARRTLALGGRVSVIDFAEDIIDLDGTTVGVQTGATYLINLDGVAVHLVLEENTNRFNRSQFRAIGVLDLAFNPET